MLGLAAMGRLRRSAAAQDTPAGWRSDRLCRSAVVRRWRISLALLGLSPLISSCMTSLPAPLLLAGQLPATLLDQGCPRLANLNGSQTPEQLYAGMTACLRRSERARAVLLFSLAAAYGRYDALRLADPAAHRGSTLLRIRALQQLDLSERRLLAEGLATALSEGGHRADLCAAIERIGPPTYRPGATGRHALVRGFDADSSWNQVLDRFLRCSKT